MFCAPRLFSAATRGYYCYYICWCCCLYEELQEEVGAMSWHEERSLLPLLLSRLVLSKTLLLRVHLYIFVACCNDSFFPPFQPKIWYQLLLKTMHVNKEFINWLIDLISFFSPFQLMRFKYLNLQWQGRSKNKDLGD